MRAGVLIAGLVLVALVLPACAHGGGGGHGGGGHGGEHSGGHGFHFGGHHGHGKGGRAIGFTGGLSSSAVVSRSTTSPRITTFVGFGSFPGLRIVFLSDGFFCPFAPHFNPHFCAFCGFPGAFGVRSSGFFGFTNFGFLGDSGPLVFNNYAPQSDASEVQPAATISRRELPVLVFTNGWSFEVTDYGIGDEGQLRYATSYGGINIVPLESLDLNGTVKANAARGIAFVLKREAQP